VPLPCARSLGLCLGAWWVRAAIFFILLVVCGTCPGNLLAPAVEATRRAPLLGQYASGVNLVEVYATVTDVQGRPVRGLAASDFKVEEDGQLQPIAVFTAGQLPLAIAVAVDRSFSVPHDRLAAALGAVRRFVSSLRPGDQVMVI